MAATRGRRKKAAKSEEPVVEVESAKESEESVPVAVEEPKEEKKVEKPKSKSLVLKHKVGDKVKFSGEEWEVLIVVNKKERERLRIGREGKLRAVWLEDLD
tara:strand:+ start:371 stop:673 length:303 start_codon:yes stop_codon:yes gene_type:complete